MVENYITNAPICFGTCALSSGSLHIVFAEVIKIEMLLKLNFPCPQPAANQPATDTLYQPTTADPNQPPPHFTNKTQPPPASHLHTLPTKHSRPQPATATLYQQTTAAPASHRHTLPTKHISPQKDLQVYIISTFYNFSKQYSSSLKIVQKNMTESLPCFFPQL
jgi:hypothetical protein